MSKIPKVAAICVNWNGGEYLREAVESLLETGYPRMEILVVDNASTDGSTGLLPRKAELLQLEENTGYGEALNRGIDLREEKPAGSRADYYLLLNNDIQVEPGTVAELISQAETKGPGIYGPAIVQASRPDLLEAAWGTVTWSHVLTRLRGKGKPVDAPPWNRPAEKVILLGSLILVHRAIIEAGVRFDPGFFMYHEEVDFIYRAAAGGFPSYYCPQARARHQIGLGTRKNPLKKVYWTRRNTIFFLRKWKAGPLKWGWCLGTMAVGFAWSGITFRGDRARTILRGMIDGFRGISERELENL